MFRSRDAFSLWGIVALMVVLAAAALLLYLTRTLLLVEFDRLPVPPADAIYRNAAYSDEERIEDLLSYMTLTEKVGQMALIEKHSVDDMDDVTTYGLGGILSGAGAKPETNTPAGWRDMIMSFDTASRASRLGIPVLYGADANHGHGNVPGATIFPHTIGLGASGDAALIEAIAKATGEEMRATGIRWNFSPTLDLPKDIRWGRVFETFSDDPVRAGLMGAAYVRGLQGAERPSVLATLKHYVGVGAMQWGSSQSDIYTIDQGTTPPTEVALRTQYLPPFKAALEVGAQSVMVGLGSWGDIKLSASPYLIRDVLKGELGFEGFVVSDWYGVYEIPGGDYLAAVTAINAGVDMVMLPFEYRAFIWNVSRAVHRGDISSARIDDAVRRILRAKFALGLFDETPVAGGLDVVGSDAHRALAREAVSKSLVLLKDDTDVLPLSPEQGLIRVAGSSADNTGRQAGGWTIEWQGVDGNVIPGATSILAGIREVAGEKARIEFDAAGNFREDEIAEVGIAVVGESPYAEGWGDTAEPQLSAEDLATIERMQESAARVVVVLVTGRPLILPASWRSWDALLVAWLPGSEGAGVADVLFGTKPFVGTIPLPWPRTMTQLPMSTSGIGADGTSPLFPRYFGLK